MSNINFEIERKRLVNKLEERGIKDRKVLEAFSRVKRELFVPIPFHNKAYDDSALPIARSQTISQPYTVALMTSLLEIKPGDKILEIGTGSGYQAAILEEMGAEVFTVERIEELKLRADSLLQTHYPNIKTFIGDGTVGLMKYAPYDGIIITAAAPIINENLKLQLKIGGSLVVPLGNKLSQKMIVIKRLSDYEYTQKEYGSFKFVPLIGKFGFND